MNSHPIDPTPEWYDKFQVVRRSTGEEVVELKFTLLPERDQAARIALAAYSDAIKQTNPGLASDIMSTIDKLTDLQI